MSDKITEHLFQGSLRYVQGTSAFRNAPKYLSVLGKAPLVICDSETFTTAGREFIATLERAGFEVGYAEFVEGNPVKEIDRLATLARDYRVEFIIGLGASEALDCAKVIAQTHHLPLASIPTTAATDAPCSAVSYAPNGPFDHYSFSTKNPNVLLVDTSVIAKSPARFLASEIGDAIATHLEAQSSRKNASPWKGLTAEVVSAIGDKCQETLFKYGKLAYEANKAHAVTPAFEAVVEANTLLSRLSFESGGVAAAHSIHNGLSVIPALHSLLHGEKVAFGVVVQLVLLNAPPSELDKYIAFLLSIALPVTFELLGIPDVLDEELRAVSKLACSRGETIWTMDIGDSITEDKVFHAIKGADAAGREYIRRTNRPKTKL